MNRNTRLALATIQPSGRRLPTAIGAALALATLISAAATAAQSNTVYESGFDHLAANQPPKVWTTFTPGTKPHVVVLESGVLQGRRSDDGGLVDDLVVKAGRDLPEPGKAPTLPDAYELWTGPPIPEDPARIPFVQGIEHRTIHSPDADGYKFLHGAAILQREGTFYANWANSPVNENGPHETLQGRRSTDGGVTWSPLEIIGPGFDGPDRHSHGVLFVHQGKIWTICARFGVGEPAKRFPGLKAEAFVLNPRTDRWDSRGIVMKNCWPYDAPVKMGNGNYITGGQDKDGLPVVAISHGEDFTKSNLADSARQIRRPAFRGSRQGKTVVVSLRPRTRRQALRCVLGRQRRVRIVRAAGGVARESLKCRREEQARNRQTRRDGRAKTRRYAADFFLTIPNRKL